MTPAEAIRPLVELGQKAKGMMSVAKDFLASGEAAIDQMIQEKRGETLHLEFKTLSSTNGLNRDDRKTIAKAITGFCNAEGGLLIIGIETARVDGIDVATKPRPVAEPERAQNLIRAAVPEMLSPQHNGIAVETIACSSAPDHGFILIAVPPSDNRPHMDLLEQRYFRRGSDGTRVLVHQEVRELMFVGREGALEIKCGIRPGVSSGDLKFDLKVVLVIQNVGRVPVSAPFVQIDQPSWNIGENQCYSGGKQGVSLNSSFLGVVSHRSHGPSSRKRFSTTPPK